MIIPGVLFGCFAGYMLLVPQGLRLQRSTSRGAPRAFWCWMIGFYLAFMPLYVLGFMGMPRRMEHYNDPSWQPWLVAAVVGAVLIAARHRLPASSSSVVSIRDRREHAPTSPAIRGTAARSNGRPPRRRRAYNFAVLPEVRDREPLARHEGARRRLRSGRAPTRTSRCRRTPLVGVVLGGLAFVLGFGMVWHIWWLADRLRAWPCGSTARCARPMTSPSIVLSAAEVSRIEDARYRAMGQAGDRP